MWVTSNPARPSTEVEAPDEHEASERRHEERCSEVQCMNADEGEVRRGNEEEEGRAAKPARDPGAQTTTEIAKHAVSHWPYRSWCSHCNRGRGRSRQRKTNKSSEKSIQVLGADCCFISGEMAANESRMLVVVDT